VKTPYAFCYSQWFAILAGYDHATEYFYQDVTIPPDALQAHLRFAYSISTHEVGSEVYDTLKVEVLRPSDDAVLETLGTLSNLDKTSGYWRFGPTYDLSSYKGQTIRLRFYAVTNDSHLTLFLVDDIALVVVTPPETVSAPTPPDGPTNGVIQTSYFFTTGGSTSSSWHPVQYLFDWGDGTTSEWLAVGVTRAEKTWKDPGIYQVKVRARCVTHAAVVSSWSQSFSIQIMPIQVFPQSPSGHSIFDSCSLTSAFQPQFQWSANAPLKKYTVLISTSPTDFMTGRTVLAKGSVSGTSNTWKPSFFVWKKILQASYNAGAIRDVYWKVAGTKPDGTLTETEVRSFRIEASQPVSIHTPIEGEIFFSSVAPTVGFDAYCNKKFTLEFSPLGDFSDPLKIRSVPITVTNTNSQTPVQKTLPSFQWKGITKSLGAGGYLRIKAWDGMNRETISEVRTFRIQ
jgi:hypothetical protein